MVDPMDDDLILGPVTYFKFPTATNGSELAEDTGFDLSRVKPEPTDTYEDPCSNGYQTNDNYHPPYFPGSFFPYQTPTQENNLYEQPVTSSPYNNYAMKQEIKLEPVDYPYHEQHVPVNPFHNYNNHYLYPTQNSEFWHNSSYSQVYGYPQQCYQQHAPLPLVINNLPKKRGRKKKIKIENENLKGNMVSHFPVDMIQLMSQQERAEQAEGKVVTKERRKHDRFNGMTEEEVSKRTLPDLLISNLDIVIIGINPGLFAAYKGHHYAGPGNHFWKCLYLSGLTSEPMTADDDYKLLQNGIGFTNMVERATKGSSDLTRKEIREGGQMLLEKLQRFKPKIAVFNGKLIFEVFSGKKEFNFGRQPDFVDGTNTYMWVMPSSSARCAQLPRASDKVPYYTALKKFRDYLNGAVSTLDENDIVFQYCKLKTFGKGLKEEQRSDDSLHEFEDDELSNSPIKSEYIEPLPLFPPTRKKKKSEEKKQMENPDGVIKKKRGRPKKIRPEIVVAPVNNPSPNTSKYFEPCSPVFSPSYQQQYPSVPLIPSTSDNVNEYYTQNSLDSAFSTYDFHPSEIQSHLRSFLPSSRIDSQSQ